MVVLNDQCYTAKYGYSVCVCSSRHQRCHSCRRTPPLSTRLFSTTRRQHSSICTCRWLPCKISTPPCPSSSTSTPPSSRDGVSPSSPSASFHCSNTSSLMSLRPTLQIGRAWTAPCGHGSLAPSLTASLTPSMRMTRPPMPLGSP